jgi:DNA-binding NtrC family response regulator
LLLHNHIAMPETPKVLIVDDEENFCRSLLKILTARKISATAVNRGDAALEELSREPYDVVLLDVKMPGISGIEVLKLMKDRGIKAEVIVLSGHASLDTAVEIVKYGAYDYLLKPCDTDELLLKISNAFEQRLEKKKLR